MGGYSSKKQVSRKHSSSSSKSNDEEIPNAAYNCIDLHDAETVSIEVTFEENSSEKCANFVEQFEVIKMAVVSDPEKKRIDDENDNMTFNQRNKNDDFHSEIIVQILDELISCVLSKTRLENNHKEDESEHVIVESVDYAFKEDVSNYNQNGIPLCVINRSEKPKRKNLKSPEVKLNRAYQLRAKDIKKKFVPSSSMGL